jgi:hypothetical protein
VKESTAMPLASGTRWFFLTETYLTTDGGRFSAGVRLNREHFIANLSAISVVTFGDGIVVLPVVTLGWRF